MTLSGHILVRGVFAYKLAYQDLLLGACLFFFSFFLLLVSLMLLMKIMKIAVTQNLVVVKNNIAGLAQKLVKILTVL